MRTHPSVVLLLLALHLGGCVANALTSGDPDEGDANEPLGDGDLGVSGDRLSVGSAVSSRCSTTSVRALSLQLIEELNCIRPGSMSRIDDIAGLSLSEAAFPYLQSEAAAGLRRAIARRGGTLELNSGLRTLPQQYLLYRWSVTGRCGIGIAAAPGRSNHQSGLAVDVDNFGAWRSTLQSVGFRWFGSGDEVHFDFQGGTDIRNLSVLAFQRLWNRAHPEDRIAADGDYGPATESRLARAPSEGFATGTTCGGPSAGPSTPSTPTAPPTASEPTVLPGLFATWTRLSSGLYSFDIRAPESVTKVEVLVGGYQIGSATRVGEGFTVDYRFMYERESRSFEVRGLNSAGTLVARGSGSIDSVAGVAVFVRPFGDQTWEIGLERAPSGVASLEASVDGFALTDGVSGTTRSPRLAVRTVINRMGERTFRVATYGRDGAARGTLTRPVILR